MDRIMQFFNYTHLPQNLQGIGQSFLNLANQIQEMPGENRGKEVALEKLLEARDWTLRGVGGGQIVDNQPKTHSPVSNQEARSVFETGISEPGRKQ